MELGELGWEGGRECMRRGRVPAREADTIVVGIRPVHCPKPYRQPEALLVISSVAIGARCISQKNGQGSRNITRTTPPAPAPFGSSPSESSIKCHPASFYPNRHKTLMALRQRGTTVSHQSSTYLNLPSHIQRKFR